MDKQQRELEVQKAERQLDESTARLRRLDARAKQRDAQGAIAEITGLQALDDRIRRQLRAWKDADEASFEALRDQIRRGGEALSRGTDAAADRFDRLDDANDRWLDAETDQVGAAFDMFAAWLGEESLEDRQAAADAGADLRAAWDDAGQKREKLKSAAADKKDEVRRDLQGSLGRMKTKLRELAARFKQKTGNEQRV